MNSLSRRSFLATTGVALLAACGDSSGSSGSDSDSLADKVIVPRFNSTVLTSGDVRLPISFGLTDGSFLKDGPAQVTGRIVDIKGDVVTDDLVALKHNTGIPNAYWLFTATLTEPNLYRLLVDGANPDGQALQINDPAQILVPKAGEPLPPFDTPTTADGRGVNPICTDEPACSFHTKTLTEALATGKPVAYLIGTPAYCQTGFCGPILRLLENVAKDVGDAVEFVHAEVYTDRTIATASPAVDAYHLDYEPILWVADATGTIRHRLDVVMDQEEMAAAVKDALAA